MGGQLFSSAGHIASLFVARGPNFSQESKLKAETFVFAGRMWPYIAPCWFRAISEILY